MEWKTGGWVGSVAPLAPLAPPPGGCPNLGFTDKHADKNVKNKKADIVLQSNSTMN